MPREVTAQEVADVIGIEPPAAGTADAVWLARAVAAVNTAAPRTVPRLRLLDAPPPPPPPDPPPDWPDDIRAALLMQAQRLFARRSSPTGVAAYTDTGPAYVARWDPDIERLLEIGSWAPPQAG
ncbi:hypothetical protein [Streptomyces sp. NPDC059247]|uniref:hypothetical protein n=1 Tax=Streptomyces sp. NPDC059247 TaxID=3346790 RepID=UPI0036AE2C20